MRKLNNEKTELLLLNARHRPLSQLTSTHVGTELIVAADSAKTIGIWFDNNLSMNKHDLFIQPFALHFILAFYYVVLDILVTCFFSPIFLVR